MYHFLSGYTAKVAGTEKGVTEPKATFSTCFGAPFLPLPPGRYATMLGEKIARHGARVWLVNTGWTGGGLWRRHAHEDRVHAGDDSRGAVRRARSRRLQTRDPVFNLEVPASCPDVPAEVLQPRATWPDRVRLRRAGRQAGGDVRRELQEVRSRGVTAEVKAAGPAACDDRLSRRGPQRTSPHEFEAVIGLEIHAQLLHRVEDLLRLQHGVRRRRPIRIVCPVCLGLPGALPVLNRAAVDFARPRRAGARLPDQRDVDLRAQELLLSRSAQGLPDLAVRAAARQWRRGRVRRQRQRAAPHRHHPRPHGRGRRQVAARRLSRFGSQELRRLQPQRHAAHRDRHRARSHGRRPMPPQFFSRLRAHARLARGQRRQHGRGQSALRRERLGAAARRRRRSAPRPRSRT